MSTSAPLPIEQPNRKKKKRRDLVVFIAAGLFVILALNFQAFEIPSTSMEKTLLTGDHIFIKRGNFLSRLRESDIHHGDVVVFFSPVQQGLYVVKRIIGLPGDRIRLRDDVLYRNGQKIDEPYINNEGPPADPYAEDFPSISPLEARNALDPAWQLAEQSYIQDGDLVVPAGRYFAMGDHRNMSWDSRYFGFFSIGNIVGKPLFVYWSFPTPNDLWAQSPPAKLDFVVRHEILHFFDETRWRRTLRLIQ